jgi:hypothetical protein
MADVFSRRNLLLGLAGTAAVGTVVTQPSAGAGALSRLLRPIGPGQRDVDLATAGVDDWSVQVGTYFTAHTGHVLRLADVQSFPDSERPQGLREGAFVARFDVTKGGALRGSEIYRMSHLQGGLFDLFLTSGDAAEPSRMLAVFG